LIVKNLISPKWTGAAAIAPQTYPDPPMTSAEMLSSETEKLHSTNARNVTIAKVFEAVVAESGSRIAIKFGDQSITYSELNRRANRLAHRLQALGVGPDVLVGVLGNRSLELIIALLAVLKAGGGYVPLDPEYPAERLSYMINDTQCAAVISSQSVLDGLPQALSVATLNFDAALHAGIDTDPESTATASNIAYVMYTSGSTGMPKGVVAEQRSIVRLVRNTNYCEFRCDDSWLQFAPLSFDASTLEIWGALLNGGRLVVAPQRASLGDVGRLIRDEKITSAWLTTGLFALVIEQQVENLKSLRQLLSGGDVLSPRHVRLALAGLPDCTVINGYGPTENTTFTCCHRMQPGEHVLEPVPIGRPISNSTVYILDEHHRPVPAGTTGELFTGGDGVARGYLNNPSATAEKFLPDPFSIQPGARMYRTGDLARWRDDGCVEFIGRADNQVKILGHRIELGEIETVLAQHPEIAQSCVIAHADGSESKRLIAYYVSKGLETSPPELRRYLAGRLPRYMVPALLVPMCQMPLNANGKFDRAALPKPQVVAVDRAEPAPGTNNVEDIIMQAWRRAVRIDQINPDDNFFDIGGDSLRLVAVHADLERQLHREIPIMDLFEATTVRALAAKARRGERG
jgi:amino acid adenylation domain-containing protein